jgi:hypothetical protein
VQINGSAVGDVKSAARYAECHSCATAVCRVGFQILPQPMAYEVPPPGGGHQGSSMACHRIKAWESAKYIRAVRNAWIRTFLHPTAGKQAVFRAPWVTVHLAIGFQLPFQLNAPPARRCCRPAFYWTTSAVIWSSPCITPCDRRLDRAL